MKPGDLITPTGVLVLDADVMHADREAWLKARRWRRPIDVTGARIERDDLTDAEWNRHGYRIGSSDVPSILDLDGVGTPVHVFRNKVHGVEKPVTEQMRWGSLFEGVIAQEWQRRNRCVVDEIGLVAHKDKPWHQSTIDRRVVECPTIKGMRNECGLEVKNVGFSSAERWGRDFPDRIIAQNAHQIFVTGYHHMHLAVNVGGNMMRPGIIYRDRESELIEYVVAEVDRFREQHLLTGVEPDWSDAKADKLIELDKVTHPIRAGEASVEDIGWLMSYAEAQRREADAAKEKKQAQAQLARIANGVEMVLFGDRPAWSYRKGERRSVDLDKLTEKYPDAAADSEVVTTKVTYTLVVDQAYRIKAPKGAER